MSEMNSKLGRELQLLQSEHDHVEKTNEKLSKEIKDKMNLISQLEQVRFLNHSGKVNGFNYTTVLR